MKRQILFIGCGKGGELLSYPETGAVITGLEPSDECRGAALVRVRSRKDIVLLPDSIFAHCGKKYDEIELLFPAPAMLALRAGELAECVDRLLKVGGFFAMYSEIWPENGNLLTCIACERLSVLMAERGLLVEEEIRSMAELPPFVRGADFLGKADPDTPLRFRKLTALKTGSASFPEKQDSEKTSFGRGQEP